jgi:hypothetical protein
MAGGMRFSRFGLVSGLLVSALALPTVQSRAQAAVEVTPCDVLSRPMEFNGKTVRVSGTVQTGLDDFVMRAPGCSGTSLSSPQAIWIDYPRGTHGKAGPAMRIALAVSGAAAMPIPAAAVLDRGRDFERFDAALSVPLPSRGLCLGCAKSAVTATLTGRIDAVPVARIVRTGARYSSAAGFGTLNRYRARLVLESVSNVVEKDNDYQAASAELGMVRHTLSGDPFKHANRLPEAFLNGTAVYGQVRRAAVIYGTPGGEPTGITVSYGPPNEDTEAEDAAASASAPGGLLIHVTLDRSRLPMDALTYAIFYAGSVAADLREPGEPSAHLALEQHALETVLLAAIAANAKNLVLPSGAVLWNDEWAPVDRQRLSDIAITRFLRAWEANGR